MYAWVLPRDYTKKLLRDRESQARLVGFKEAARIPPDSLRRWLALRNGDMPSSYYGNPWAQEEYRFQSIQDTEMFLKSCANCKKSVPYVWEEGGEVADPDRSTLRRHIPLTDEPKSPFLHPTYAIDVKTVIFRFWKVGLFYFIEKYRLVY
ncbi:hypothetical protein PC9H_005900 [Pleurotus ostreatus]|uniref:Uncharacterized protein n=1 Tax=Pleurotus ostreatus TaxID=5322 RepID=A0A8H6ZT33_PLEOS|nr:uncharacterized protein PC9H_005900 [Pleurotus ostreatus]KAF7430199.1 hypothetical protein PC9H_005900 [Pleurotus ostreatus]